MLIAAVPASWYFWPQCGKLTVLQWLGMRQKKKTNEEFTHYFSFENAKLSDIPANSIIA